MPTLEIGPSGTPGSMMNLFKGPLEKMDTEISEQLYHASRLGSWDSSDPAHGGLLIALRDIRDNTKKVSDAFTQRMASLWYAQMAQYTEYSRSMEEALRRKHRKDFHDTYPQQQSHLHARRKEHFAEDLPASQKRRSDLCESFGYVFDLNDQPMGLFVDRIFEQMKMFREVVATQTANLQEARHVDEQRLHDALNKVMSKVALLSEHIERKVRAAQWDADLQRPHAGIAADTEPTLY